MYRLFIYFKAKSRSFFTLRPFVQKQRPLPKKKKINSKRNLLLRATVPSLAVQAKELWLKVLLFVCSWELMMTKSSESEFFGWVAGPLAVVETGRVGGSGGHVKAGILQLSLQKISHFAWDEDVAICAGTGEELTELVRELDALLINY